MLLREQPSNLNKWVVLPLDQRHILPLTVLDDGISRHVVIRYDTEVCLRLWSNNRAIEDVWVKMSEIKGDEVGRGCRGIGKRAIDRRSTIGLAEVPDVKWVGCGIHGFSGLGYRRWRGRGGL